MNDSLRRVVEPFVSFPPLTSCPISSHLISFPHPAVVPPHTVSESPTTYLPTSHSRIQHLTAQHDTTQDQAGTTTHHPKHAAYIAQDTALRLHEPLFPGVCPVLHCNCTVTVLYAVINGKDGRVEGIKNRVLLPVLSVPTVLFSHPPPQLHHAR